MSPKNAEYDLKNMRFQFPPKLYKNNETAPMCAGFRNLAYSFLPICRHEHAKKKIKKKCNYAEIKYKSSSFVFTTIFHELNSKI